MAVICIKVVFVRLAEIAADVQRPCTQIVVVIIDTGNCEIAADMHLAVLIRHIQVTVRGLVSLSSLPEVRILSCKVIVSSDIKYSTANIHYSILLVQRSRHRQRPVLEADIFLGHHVPGHRQVCSVKFQRSVDRSQLSVYRQVISAELDCSAVHREVPADRVHSYAVPVQVHLPCHVQRVRGQC